MSGDDFGPGFFMGAVTVGCLVLTIMSLVGIYDNRTRKAKIETCHSVGGEWVGTVDDDYNDEWKCVVNDNK